jgi:hypothetical protein
MNRNHLKSPISNWQGRLLVQESETKLSLMQFWLPKLISDCKKEYYYTSASLRPA